MRTLKGCGNDLPAIQEMNDVEIDAASGGNFMAYSALVGAAVGVYSAGEKVGSSMGRAFYLLTHR